LVVLEGHQGFGSKGTDQKIEFGPGLRGRMTGISSGKWHGRQRMRGWHSVAASA
jgi:hypothetical protein